MNDKEDCTMLLELLARWEAFSELQQRAFEFLSAEAIATGQEFERSTDGATGVLARMSTCEGAGELQAKTFEVVQKLQAADRSRQGLEQVASVLNTLRGQHAELVDSTRTAVGRITPSADMALWIEALAGTVCLADWRRRLVDALHGREPTHAPSGAAIDEDELF